MLVATSNFLVPNWTFVVELVIFLLVLAILAKYILPPINRALENRQKQIEQSIEDAEEAKQKARELEEQRQKTLEEGRAEARSLKDEASKLGEQLREQLRQQGEEEYRRLVDRAAQDIDASTRRAAEELRAQVAGLVMVVVEKVLGEGITVTGQEQLVDRAIADIERQSAANGGGSGGPTSPGPGSEGPVSEGPVATKAGG
ncbi:MAG TPA: F0F1 ATP synthase subunit B [Acidimicrobiales bacterium]|nr:F0F1 ATP synthase subunit B [Acidimicrobiales bacterium]